MPKPKEIECYLSTSVLHDLIAVHLQSISVVHSSEDVGNVCLTPSANDGVYNLRFTVEPKTEVIYHK